MKLSEKIVTLRNQNQLSQGDLAEKLNVSRQSVSKWETGASTPDLDKLIAMSELFHVTMDELVKDEDVFGNTQCESVVTNEDTKQKEREKVTSYREHNLPVKIVGVILVALTPIMVILGTLGFIPYGGMINALSLYLLICGFICIFSKKNAGRRILIMSIVIVAIIIAVIVSNTAVDVSIS